MPGVCFPSIIVAHRDGLNRCHFLDSRDNGHCGGLFYVLEGNLARRKIGLDYFPVDVSWDQSVKILKAKYGLKGIGFLLSIWQAIYAEGYFAKWGEDEQLLFSSENGLSESETEEMVSFSMNKGIFDKDIFDAHAVLTSHGIQKRYLEACLKRSEIVFQEEYLLINPKLPASSRATITIEKLKESGSGLKESESVSTESETAKKGAAEPQRKGKERKVEETNQPQQKIIPHTGQNTNVNALFFALKGKQPNSYEAKTLVEIKNKYPQDRIEYAFSEAGNAGANLKYVLAVLEGKGKKKQPEGGLYETPKSQLDGWKPPHVLELERLAREGAANAG